MSLGCGALQVGGGPEQFRLSREVSMATLQAGTAPEAAVNWHRHTEKGFSEQYLPNPILTYTHRPQRAGGVGARIRYGDLLVICNNLRAIDPH